MKRCLCILSLVLCAPSAWADTPAETRVMIVGTYHMANPGQDLHNMQADDVLEPDRQTQIRAVTGALAAFEPTVVAVEWPADITDERYAKYLDGSLEPSRNEVVQLGFRLAKQAGLERVHGIDVEGEFPFDGVQAWAQANGRGEELAAMNRQVGEKVAEMQQRQETGTVVEILRFMNTPDAVAWGHGFYMRLLGYGAGDEQPGARLISAWAERNYHICARLLQTLEPGDRAVVFYGSGHNYYLRRCALDTPGVELVEANAWLPE